jgi:hypothetical protein
MVSPGGLQAAPATPSSPSKRHRLQDRRAQRLGALPMDNCRVLLPANLSGRNPTLPRLGAPLQCYPCFRRCMRRVVINEAAEVHSRLERGSALVTVRGSGPPAQPSRRISVLLNTAESNTEGQQRLAAFRQRLERLGWTEGRNVSSTCAGAPQTKPRNGAGGLITERFRRTCRC